MESILFSRYAVVSFTQALLGILITSYLLMSSKKDCSAWRLITFFAALSASMCSSFLLMAIHTSYRAWFGPAQRMLSLLALVAMIQFAYTFPGGEASGQSRWALLLSGLLVVSSFLVGGAFEDRQDIAIVWLGFISVVLCVWLWLVFLLRSAAFTREATGRRLGLLRHCGLPLVGKLTPTVLSQG